MRILSLACSAWSASGVLVTLVGAQLFAANPASAAVDTTEGTALEGGASAESTSPTDNSAPAASDVTEGSGLATPASTPASDAAAPHYVGSFALDPAGFLLFGPTAAVEFGAGRIAGGATFRWFDPGLLSHALFLNASSNFAPSFGGGLRGRYYFRDGFQGFHAGVTVELLASNVEEQATLTVAKSLYIVPQIEGGYRFAWGRFFLGPSAAIGYAAQLSASVENLPGGTQADLYVVQNRSSVYGSARLDLGVLF
jgi:hypothetical protein